MSDWTSLEKILQDLSVAQGHVVPAALETFDAVGPPAYNMEEEYEDQFTHEVGGSGDIPAPDYKLIQNMLKIVKEEEDQDNEMAQSSDPDPQDTPQAQKLKNKSKRNVAMSSIMSAKKAKLSPTRPMPKDVIPMMFKKKSPSHTEVQTLQQLNHRSEDASPLQTFSPSPDKLKQFTPSANASAYYNKYLEKSQLREQFEEDIWARAERQMKEVEEKKKQKSEVRSPQERGNTSPLDDASLAAYAAFDVSLPEHRHLQPGDCIVCIVHAEHGYYF